MNDNATVSGNTANAVTDSSLGGGVSISGGGNFTMNDSATVCGNTAYSSDRASYGGGVYVASGSSLTINDNATVSGNTAESYSHSSSGGGIAISGGGNFTKIGGVIYGKNEGTNSNTIIIGGVEQTNRSAAIYVDSSHLRETTVRATQNLSISEGVYTGQWTD
jgi:hypothetical protein